MGYGRDGWGEVEWGEMERSRAGWGGVGWGGLVVPIACEPDQRDRMSRCNIFVTLCDVEHAGCFPVARQVAKGPNSSGVVRLARELGGVSVRGNHEFEVRM